MPRKPRFEIYKPRKSMNTPTYGLYLFDRKTGKKATLRQSRTGKLWRVPVAFNQQMKHVATRMKFRKPRK